MERLTYKTEKDGRTYCPPNTKCDGNCNECGHMDNMMNKLADYEDAEEQGLLLKLPVAIGSTVYVIDSIYECKFDHDCKLSFDAYKCEEDIRCEYECKKYHPRETRFNHMMLDKIGKTVFLTREEVKQALEEQLKAGGENGDK